MSLPYSRDCACALLSSLLAFAGCLSLTYPHYLNVAYNFNYTCWLLIVGTGNWGLYFVYNNSCHVAINQGMLLE